MVGSLQRLGGTVSLGVQASGFVRHRSRISAVMTHQGEIEAEALQPGNAAPPELFTQRLGDPAFALSMAGCAPAVRPAVAVTSLPPKFEARATAGPVAAVLPGEAWWRDFADPQLTSLVEQALTRSTGGLGRHLAFVGQLAQLGADTLNGLLRRAGAVV